METTWRLKATRGHGWIEHVDADGRPSVTAMPKAAKQFPSREAAGKALARFPPGGVEHVPVPGPAFERREHGAPSRP